MKQLTKKQRHLIYKKGLRKLNTKNYLCHIINGFEDAPEFDLIKPEGFTSKNAFGSFEFHNDGLRWDGGSELGKKLREIILLLCIEMTR